MVVIFLIQCIFKEENIEISVLFFLYVSLSITLVYICFPFLIFRWFAKRFLHPDVVSIYDYIFLWDEDLGVENFTPER